MSLEEQFAKLTVDDAAGIVEKVKADGPVKSGLADGIVALVGRCASSEEAEALSGFATVKALAEGAPAAQPFIKDCLGACKLNCCFCNITWCHLSDGSFVGKSLHATKSWRDNRQNRCDVLRRIIAMAVDSKIMNLL